MVRAHAKDRAACLRRAPYTWTVAVRPHRLGIHLSGSVVFPEGHRMHPATPYETGDVISVATVDGEREAIVWTAVLTPALDPNRRWRLLCRWRDDGSSVEQPVYCGDDGLSPALRREGRMPA